MSARCGTQQHRCGRKHFSSSLLFFIAVVMETEDIPQIFTSNKTLPTFDILSKFLAKCLSLIDRLPRVDGENLSRNSEASVSISLQIYISAKHLLSRLPSTRHLYTSGRSLPSHCRSVKLLCGCMHFVFLFYFHFPPPRRRKPLFCKWRQKNVKNLMYFCRD